MRLGLLVELGKHDARFADDPAGMDLLDLVHGCKVQHDAAGKRHGLAVIAGASAARRDRHAMGIGDLQRSNDLFLGLRRDDEIGRYIVELRLQDRRVPIEIPALLANKRGIVLNGDALEFLLIF